MNTTCECNACKNMEELDLKIFLHHGEYINQNFNGTDDLAGSDVNTIFRLMKNSVVDTTSIEAYLLITKSALQAMELERNFSNSIIMFRYPIPEAWRSNRKIFHLSLKCVKIPNQKVRIR